MKLPFISKKKTATTDFTPRRRLSSYQDKLSGLAEPLKLEHANESESKSFRLNRTITGSRSALISSANEHDAQLVSPRAQVHSLRKHQRRLRKWLLGCSVAIIFLMVLLFQGIASVDVSLYGQVGAMDQRQKARYESILDDYLAENPSQRFRWGFNSREAATYLQTHAAPEVGSIQGVAGNGIGKASFVIRVREPLASWTIQSSQYFVDKSGVVFSHNYFGTPSVTIIDESRLSTNTNYSKVTSQRFLNFIGRAMALYREAKIPIEKVFIPSDTTRQVDFQVQSGPRLKLTIDRTVGEQVEDSIRAANYLRARQVTASYIDVRVSQKAFYREG